METVRAEADDAAPRGSTEHVRCGLCGADEPTPYALARSKWDRRRFSVVRCGRCGLVYVSPRVRDKEDEIRTRREPSAEELAKWTTGHRLERMRVALARVERYCKPGRLLDFGCGPGALVHEALARGWDAVGVDLHGGLIRAANRYWGDDRLKAADVAEAARTFGRSFDAIVSTHTFEHLTDPLRTLRTLRPLLRDGGVCYVEVPNLGDLRERLRRGATLDPTAHLYYFTPQSLAMLMRGAGFDVLACSGRPAMLGVWTRLGRVLQRPGLASKAAVLCGRLPLPSVGPGAYVVGRASGGDAGAA
jgi:2-polyprenyl-3-methyl-5-hydroxy-6-metoxy-1,4-benzoquinol methylase